MTTVRLKVAEGCGGFHYPDLARGSTTMITVSGPQSLAEFLAEVEARYPRLTLDGAMVIINATVQIQDEDRVMADGDEVQIVPPYSGG